MQPRCSSRPMATACFWSQALGHTFFPATFCVMLQMVKVKNFNARDDESIRHLIHRSNLVVNCIGIQKETMNWSFQETHVDIAAKIAQACKENEMVERFWHVGCLGANENSTSRRLQSKVRSNPAQLYIGHTTWQCAHPLWQAPCMPSIGFSRHCLCQLHVSSETHPAPSASGLNGTQQLDGQTHLAFPAYCSSATCTCHILYVCYSLLGSKQSGRSTLRPLSSSLAS